MKQSQRWRTVGWLLPVLLAGAGGIAGHRALSAARRELPLAVGTRLSKALGRPVVLGRVSLWPLGAFSLGNVRVPVLPGEECPPLVARRVRVNVSWWQLLVHQRVQVTGLHVDGARVCSVSDLRRPAAAQANATEELLSLGRAGLQRIGIHDSSLAVTTVLPSGERRLLSATGVDLEMDLRRAPFAYRVQVARWAGAGLVASDLRLAGQVDAGRITLSDSRARFANGLLEASGAYVTEHGDLALRVRATALPLADLAPELGIPREWGVQGRLTGALEVSATSGQLQRMQGTVSVQRGSITHSHTVFPWTHATAQVDWQPANVVVRDLDVVGNGVRLRGSGEVRGEPSVPVAQRDYHVAGTIEADSAGAVASLAQLLAFSTPVPGPWRMDRAAISFRAHGTVGDPQQAWADGRLQAWGLTLPAGAAGGELRVEAIEGDVERSPASLHLRNLRATAPGMVAAGQVAILPERGRRAGTYRADGRLDLTDLAALRQQWLGAPFWQWLPPGRSTARGRVTFAAAGPTARLDQTQATGAFLLRELSLSVPLAATGAPDGQRWTVPVGELTGRLRLAERQLVIDRIAARTDLFSVTGEARLADVRRPAGIQGSLRLVSDRWAELPPLSGHLPAGLEGGTLVIGARAVATHARAGSPQAVPVSAAVMLRGATYRVTARGKMKRLPLREVTATVRVQDNRVEVPAYRLVTPWFRIAGRGDGHRQATAVTPNAAWLMHGEGVVVADDVGALARWGWGVTPVERGRLVARYVADAPLTAPARGTLIARLRLTDAPILGTPAALRLSGADLRILSLTGTVAVQNGAARVTDAAWRAPRFRATGAGTFDGRMVDGTFRIVSASWKPLLGEAARTLPVVGGVLSFAGALRGPADDVLGAALRGTIALRNARLASGSGAVLPVARGLVDLDARLDGPLNELAKADVSGWFAARNLALTPLRAGARPVPIPVARGHFQRSGPRVMLTQLVAAASGARLDGEGEILNPGTASSSHRFAFAARGAELAAVLPALAPVPGVARGGHFTGSLVVRGTAAAPLAWMEGRAEVRGGAWTPPGQSTPLTLTGATAHFVRQGSVARLDAVELRTPGGSASLTGTMSGLGSGAAARHTVRLVWRLENASAWATRFLPVPGWFTGGLFSGSATICGSAANPTQTAAGSFAVQDAGFMPPQRFLGGPVKPIIVRRAGGRFRRGRSQTELTDLQLDTSIGTARGLVVVNDRGVGTLRARATIARLAALVDLWPAFTKRLQGGSGEIAMALHGPLRQPGELAGTVRIIGKHGVLVGDSAEALYATEPFDELSARLALARGDVRLEQMRMRGPKANLEAKGQVTRDGRVSGAGKAWFSEPFTRQLVRPRALRPLARLVGMKRLGSAFQVDGTVREVRVRLAITHSLLWMIAAKKIAPPLRRIATGKSPLWSTSDASSWRAPGSLASGWRSAPWPAPRNGPLPAHRQRS